MGRIGRTLVPVLAGVGLVLVSAPAVEGAQRSDPAAHTACASGGCTETSTLDMGAGGLGETMTDQIPANADQGAIQAAPTCAAARDSARAASPLTAAPLSGPWSHPACDSDAVAAFDNAVLGVFNEVGAPTGVTKKKNLRVLGCVYLSLAAVDYSWQQQPGSSYDKVVVSGTSGQTTFLQTCLQAAALISASEQSAARDAGAAAAGCSSQQVAITIALSRVGGRYRARITGVPVVTTRRAAIVVSCRRAGVGLKLTLTPRRHRTFKQAGMTSLGVSYVNRSKTPLAVRTTFKVN